MGMGWTGFNSIYKMCNNACLCVFAVITLACHFLMIVISAALVASGYDLLPVDFENLPLEINDQPWRPRDLAWTYKDGFTGFYDRASSAGERLLSYYRANIDLYYDGQGENMFTATKPQKIQSIEDKLTFVAAYQNSYCQLVDSTGTDCQKPMSVIRFFDGTLCQCCVQRSQLFEYTRRALRSVHKQRNKRAISVLFGKRQHNHSHFCLFQDNKIHNTYRLPLIRL